MSLTPSTMMLLGTKAPDFELIDVTDEQTKSLDSLKSDSCTVIIFMCNHCPFVKHILPVLSEIAQNYMKKGVQFIGISANDVEQFPEDAPPKMKALAEDQLSFPYLYDETQEVAKAYQAACTPDFFVFDKDLKCVYRGQFDGSRPGNEIPVTGSDLIIALDCILRGRPIPSEQNPSIGCNIKWKN